MSGPAPMRKVPVGRHVLAVGGPAGTLIEPGPAPPGDPSELAAALEHPAVGTAAKEGVDAISEATSRVEEAVQLFKAVADGSIDISEAAGSIDAMLRLLEQLDREGHHREALNLARAANGLLALALRWAELARSLGLAAKAAENIADPAGAAWARHELGTLHLAADDPAGAERLLSEAQVLRSELHDREGLAATEQNLGVLCRRLRELLREGRLTPRRQGPRGLAAVAIALVFLLAGVLIGRAIASDDDSKPPGAAIRLTVLAEGPGTVQSTPAGIDCPGSCARDFARRTEIVLTPEAAEGSIFEGWSGACKGTGPCRLRPQGNRTVAATFGEEGSPETARLDVDPPDNGRVTSTPDGIDCGDTCSHEFDVGQSITLDAIGAAGYRLGAWGGDCAGLGPCALTMEADRTVSATFTAERTISVTISGDGRVTSIPAGIDCTEGTCGELFPADAEQVVLTAGDGTFLRWGGDCSGTEITCTLALDANHEANASFDSPEP